MILLRLISWPDARKHMLRSVLAVMGITIGVAVFVGIRTANQSALGAFQQTINRVAGSTQLQVSAGETGFAEDVLEAVQGAPEVAVAAPVIEAVVDPGLPGEGNLLILAVDMVGDRSLRTYELDREPEEVIDDPLVFLAQPDSLILTREFARRTGLKMNSKLTMQTMDGAKQFTVRGLMKGSGLASAFGGNIAIMDIFAAQKVFGRGRKFDRIDIIAKEGTTVAQCREALSKLLGPGFQVEPPALRGQQVEDVLRVYSISMSVNSMYALLIGMFMIYSSLLIAVTQRRTQIGILCALGATRRQIMALFVGEGAVAGLLGSALGLGLGLLLARALSGYVAGIVRSIYGVAEQPRDITIEPMVAAAAFAIGVVSSMVAAVIPARAAARVDPVEALRLGAFQATLEGQSKVGEYLALALAVVAAGCLILGGATLYFYAGYLMTVLAAILLVPRLGLWLAKALRPALSWLRPIEGSLAADSLIQSPRRTSGTVVALMLSIALVVGLSGMAAATFSAIHEWADLTLNAPLFVAPSETTVSRSFRFPAAMLDQLRGIDGVQEVLSVRSVKVTIGGRPTVINATELVRFGARTPGRKATAGQYTEMHRVAGLGQGVIAADNFARLQGIGLGDTIEIPAPKGVLRLPVVGIVKDYSTSEGLVFLDRSVYDRYWDADSIDLFRLYLRPGVAPDAVKRRIQEKLATQRRLFVLSNEQVKGFVVQIAEQWFGMTYIQTAIAVLISLLGILNAMTVSITERRRELGVLRAVGGLGLQIRGAIWMEAAAIALIGLGLGLAFGAVNLFYQLEFVRRDMSGIDIGYQYPGQVALMLAPVVLLAALLSAVGPAEFAVRHPLEEALRYE